MAARVLVGVVLGAVSGVRADDPPSTTRATQPAFQPTSLPSDVASTLPATAPSTVPTLDLATPQITLRALNLALRDGDADRILQVLDAADVEQGAFASAMANFAAAVANLHHAAEVAFGPEGAKTVTGDIAGESADGLAAIERATVVIDGAVATVTFTDGKARIINLRRIGGQWKLPVSSLQSDLNPGMVAQNIRHLRDLALAAKQMAEEIGDAKYKTADRAAIVWRTRAMLAMGGTTQPASSPTTGPATRP